MSARGDGAPHRWSDASGDLWETRESDIGKSRYLGTQ